MYIDSAIKQSVQSFCKKITDRSKPKKTTLTLILLGILFGLTAWLFSTFKIDTTTTALFANDSELSRGHTIISDHFFGSNTLEIAIEYTDEHQLWERENLDKIEKIERTLQTLFHPLYTISPATIVKRNHRYRVNGLQSAYSIPKKITPSTIQNLNQYYSQWGGSQVIGMNKDVGKIIIGYKQAGLHESLRLYEELSRVLLKLSNDKIKFSLTGPAYLIDKGTYTFTRNLITGWLTGVLLSVLLIGFILRSFIKGLMLLLVNMIPIILVVVLMPKFGLEINPQSLFLLTILAGLCVDDSIYIMLQGKKREIGYFPVLVTSVVLTGGFISFGFSNLTWLSPFAWIFLIGIMAALLLDLFVLPRYTKPSDE